MRSDELMENVKRVLVIRVGRLGDTILATPIVQVLQQACGAEVMIDFAVSPGACATVLGLDQRINRVFGVSRRKIPWYLNPAKISLRKESGATPYDLVFNLECGKQCDDFVGFVHCRKFVGRPLIEPHHVAGQHCVDTEKAIYARVLGPELTAKAVPSLKIPAQATRRIDGLSGEYVIINPAFSGISRKGYRGHRRWPDHHWSVLIDFITHSGRSVAINAGEREKHLFQPLLKKPGVHSLLGAAIPELIGTMTSARCLISVDTGTMHLATALNIPTVALFGPTNPELTGPYPGNAPSRVLTSGIACQPCVQTPLQKQCRANLCMQGLSPEAVFEAFESVIAQTSPG